MYPEFMTSVELSIVLRRRQTLTAFFMDFKKTYEELNVLLPFSSDIKVPQAQREQMAVMSFLGALPPEFDTAKSQILSDTNITSLQEVFSRVLRTESTFSNQQSSVLVANKGGGVIIEKTEGVTMEEQVRLFAITAKSPDTKRYCKKLQNLNQRVQTSTATVAATSGPSSEKTVTISVDEYAKIGSAFRSHTAPSPVTIADGSNYTIEGSGTVKPTSSITLSSVLSLLSLAFNLMSDLMTKQTIGKGHVSDGLYILDAWVPRLVACYDVVSPFEAHYQLGHPSLPMLKKLCPQFHDVSSVDCESCHFAKHHRSSLNPRVNKRAEFAFELVHSDVWGPCPVLSKTGFKYFVTFVDDFSRMTWIYFMKNRLEVFTHFSAFCTEIKTHFDVHVHILRSDNAKEYMSGSFQNYINQHGILHQSSCADTPAQNGVAKRKNRHLLETARALLFQMKVPKPFWTDANSTACFLINRIPSTVLNRDVPYSVLFPTKTLFPIEPRIFGSTCFVRDVRPHLTKLDPKALKCVFLGYSRLQKGYRCYSPDLHRYLVSTDVFSEHSPFFSSKSDSSSKGEDDDRLTYEIFPTVPIEPAISEDRNLEDEDVDCLGEQAIVTSAPVKPPIVQVYSRRPEHHDTCPEPASSSSDPPPTDLDLPTGLRKDSVSIPKTMKEALSHPGWHNAMLEEIQALDDNHTWDLVNLPEGKKAVGCKLMELITLTLSLLWPNSHMFVCSISLAASLNWSLHQLDIKNAFLHGDLVEEVYMEQPPGDDCTGITSLKKFLQTKFHTKDLGQLKYFLGIEVTRSKKGIFLSQRKYVLDLLAETRKAGAKPCNTPMNPSVHLTKDDGDRLDDGDRFDDPDKYRRLVGKLNYLTVTRPDIAYAVSTVSQFMSEPTVKHWAALKQIMCYLKGAPGLGLLYSNHGHSCIECFSDADWAGSKLDRKSTTGYCVFVGGNLVSWKSKKQSVV
ncbi:hypothetical protein RJ639_019485 [Escallonia herrerae]|uniref:Integrase catalytic domain-containing protein n=1 Tax=Escallonia herrerae TaxID=1293975 RepID=A0AA88V845_9ASTE|nr:hypothetical protein RJ639_019485 [Escallonia herrerae]